MTVRLFQIAERALLFRAGFMRDVWLSFRGGNGLRVDFVANALQEIVTVHGLSVPATT